MYPIYVGIIDGSDLSRLGLPALVAKHDALKLSFVTETLAQAEVALLDKSLDIVVLDGETLTAQRIAQVIERLRSLRPKVRIILLSNTANFSSLYAILQQGMSGYVFKEDRLADTLIYAIEMVSRGQLYLSPHVSELPYMDTPKFSNQGLTPRDMSVLKLMYRGKTVQHIAQTLMLKDRAVYRSQEKLRRALCVPTTELIVVAAARRGWIADLGG